MNIGFIGTGIMGKPMAYNLQQAGHTLYFSAHFEPAPQELIGERGHVCSTPREVSQECEIIITMLPDTPHVEDVLFHPHYGVIHGLSHGKIVIDMSSISRLPPKHLHNVLSREARNISMRPSLAVKLARKPGRFPLWLADVKRFICRSNRFWN